ncbi:MAG: putative lipase, partial [Fibromonadaceae bacterium]|nr:putative lipase [Fibromonadaceae bacterium]
MINYRVMLACLFLFCGISQAAETCNTLIKEYQNKPHDRDEKQLFLDSNGYYLTYDRCSDSTDIEIISLEERVQMGFIPRDLLSLPPKPYHYNCIFRTVRVEYTIKCSNNLKYKGTEYLLSSIRNENESLDVSGEEKAKMEAETHWWIPIPLDYLNSDGSITIDPVTGKEWKDKPRKLDIASIKERWVKQAVSCPKYTFMGTPRKLPRPVLLIHGLNGNYGQWGVETYDKNSSEYKEGKVKGYTNGSLPDMLARSNNLYTEKDSTTIDGVKYSINSNGIYFFQATENSFPHWDAIPSQSQALYEKIKFIMDNYYKEQEKQGIKWSEVDDLKIDLVGHSQGGLVIREMLRGLRDDPGDITEEGTANAANHINRVITVNTPHLGSALATPSDNLSKIEPELL